MDAEDVWQQFALAEQEEEAEAAAAVEATQQDELQEEETAVTAVPRPAEPRCEFCGATDVVLDDGDFVCRACGSVNSRPIDTGAEWRCFNGEDGRGSNMTRCGLPVNELLPDSSLGSMIGYGGRETHDTRVMRKYHLWNSMSYKERTLYTIFDGLTLNAVNNGIPKCIIEEAKVLYKKVSDLRISRGDNRAGLIAASVYMSCKNHQVPRSAKEIAAVFNIKLQTMTRCAKRFQELTNARVRCSSAQDFISRFCSKINLDRSRAEICRAAVERAEELDLASENTPPSVAAAIIFMCNLVHGWGVAKKDLAAACEISQVTITKCCKRFMRDMAGGLA